MSITISLLPCSLSLIHISRPLVSSLSYPILHHLLSPNPTFLNITCNSIELSLFVEDSSSSSVLLFKGEGVEISKEKWNVLQIDSHLDNSDSGARASEISAPLAEAGISIMYQSSYTSDFIFVQEERLQEAMNLFASAGFDLYNTQNEPTSPFTNNARSRSSSSCPPPTRTMSHSPSSSEVTILPSDLICVGLSNENVDQWMLKVLKLIMFPSLVVPPPSDADTGGVIVLSNDPAISNSRVHSPIPWSPISEEDEDEEESTDESSRTSVDSLPTSLAPSTNTPAKEIPYFSFTRTPEGSSLTTDARVLATLFTEAERYMVICGDELDLIDSPSPNNPEEEEEVGTMKCLEIDLRKFGLEKHGLVNRFSRVLEQDGINHMYSSTFKTANVLVNKNHALRAQGLLREC